MKSTLRKFIVAVFSASVATLSHASFVGDTVNCSLSPSYLTSCNQSSATVGAGEEFTIFTQTPGLTWLVDIGANSVSVTLNGPANWGVSGGIGQFKLLSLNEFGISSSITGISNFFTNTNYGIDASDITFTSDSLNISFINSGWNTGQLLSFDVVTRPNQSIPEPASMALLGLGLAGIGFSRRKKA